MRKLNIAVIGLAGGTSLVAGLVWAFRRNPRLGSSFVNSVLNLALSATDWSVAAGLTSQRLST